MNNQLMISGFVGADPKVVTFGTGNKVTKFSIAVKDFSSKEEDPKPLWIDVEAWNGLGERVMSIITKGRELNAFGRLAISEYETTDKDGTKVRVKSPVLKLEKFHLTAYMPADKEDRPAKRKAKKEAAA